MAMEGAGALGSERAVARSVADRAACWVECWEEEDPVATVATVADSVVRLETAAMVVMAGGLVVCSEQATRGVLVGRLVALPEVVGTEADLVAHSEESEAGVRVDSLEAGWAVGWVVVAGRGEAKAGRTAMVGLVVWMGSEERLVAAKGEQV